VYWAYNQLGELLCVWMFFVCLNYKILTSSYLGSIAGSFKADIWRYCVLYTFGGMYIDDDRFVFVCAPYYLLVFFCQ